MRRVANKDGGKLHGVTALAATLLLTDHKKGIDKVESLKLMLRQHIERARKKSKFMCNSLTPCMITTKRIYQALDLYK